jgi:acyl-CoA thioesterase-2
MGDLEVDTRLDGGDGRWTATLRPDWEIWGPCGGYLAAILLRVASAHSPFPRPVSLTIHFLGVARFEPVDLVAETLVTGRRSQSLRISMTQDGRPITHAVVWTAADPDGRPGIEYDWTNRPDVPAAEGLPGMDELRPEDAPPFPFWVNLESRPVDWLGPDRWETERPLAPVLQSWYRFRPTAVFDDPFVEAARVAMICDLLGWPAVVRALEPGMEERFIAPNLDLSVTFHQPPRGSEFLLLDAEAPIATGGTIGGTGRVWSEDGRLLASCTQQLLARPVPTA